MHFDSVTTEKIPFPNLNLLNKNEKHQHDQLVKLVETMLELNKRLQETKLQTDLDTLQRRIDYTDNEINQLVYQLYNITEQSDIDIIEGKNA
jgi:CII-binding regulator of phage lambda lysogenization HflD